MGKLRLHRPSPALVVSVIALCVALGGTGYAAVVLPANSVGTKQLKKNAVTSAKVKNRSLLAADFQRGQLPGGPGEHGRQARARRVPRVRRVIRAIPGLAARKRCERSDERRRAASDATTIEPGTLGPRLRSASRVSVPPAAGTR